MFFFFSALLLDDTSKRPLILRVSEFILLFDSPTRTGSRFMVLPSLGAISEAGHQRGANNGRREIDSLAPRIRMCSHAGELYC